jgi:hypothetical protein
MKHPSAVPGGDGRPRNTRQDFEKVQSAPEIALRPLNSPAEFLDLVLSLSKDAPACSDASADSSTLRDATPQHEDRGLSPDVSTCDDRPKNPSQDAEKVDSAPGFRRPADGTLAPDEPLAATAPAGFSRVNVRMTLNGVMAC